MKQVIQDFKTGELSVADLDEPYLSDGFVLVRNSHSLISAGTERATVTTAQATLIGKARRRPDLVKQVMDTVKREGLVETWRRVRTKLGTLKELGYSSAGVVLASLDYEGRFSPGDRVACGGGGFASHAAIIAVPQNLVVKVPDTVGLEAAAFTTMGAIAMQGVRQAAPRIGESVCVIGLGLIGQLTCQILRANGCEVFGVDPKDALVALGERTAGCRRALVRKDANLLSAVQSFTSGRGFDSVIITASSTDGDPVELAISILRQKGVLVIVGAVPMNIPREPHFYQKELELKISCSYGPGRYDPWYEEGGRDYPYPYVRWTENRNMAAFVQLLERGSVDVAPLVSHRFHIEDALTAYDIVTGRKTEPHLGIVLSYDGGATATAQAEPHRSRVTTPARSGIGFIGAGSFAQKFLLPYAGSHGDLVSVVTSRGVTAKSVADKFGFAHHGTDSAALLANAAINTVFIATRHDSHAALTREAIEAGKHVFVEKPLALDDEELARVIEAARSHPECSLMVGYNRRFSPLAKAARDAFTNLDAPLVINYRVSAGVLPDNHWIQRAQGGGRLIGEVCHFVDLMQFLTRSRPLEVYANAVVVERPDMPSQDNISVSIRFGGGSIGHITYVAYGGRLLPKERIEIFGGDRTFVIDDFQRGEYYDGRARRRLSQAGKGHREEVDAYLRALATGAPPLINLDDLVATSLATFAARDSLRTGLPQRIPPASHTT